MSYAFLASLPACAPDDLNDSAVTAFEGAFLITGNDDEVIEDATFLVDGDRITQVGTSEEVDVSRAEVRVDLRGRTVMPALVNTHIHLPSSRDSLVQELCLNARQGVGTVVSLGEDFGDVPFQVRRESIPGTARYLTAGRGITGSEPGWSDVPYWVSTVEEARNAVIELADPKVDIVKIWVDDGGGSYRKLASELYSVIINEAHQRGLRVTAHIFYLEDAKQLMLAGIDAFAHGVRDQAVDDELLSLLNTHPDVVYVPNLPEPVVDRDWDWLRGSVSSDELERLQNVQRDSVTARARFALQAQNLARVNSAGARIGFGTDGYVAWNAHFELEDMVLAGMSPADVIVAATRNSAQLLRLDDVGTIAPGMSADFMVLEANPLEDITHTRKIEAVYLRGVLVDPSREGGACRES